MAEMSFAPRMRPARGPAKEDPLNVMGALGLDNAFNFMQGCVTQRPTSVGDPDALLVVDFPNRPAKMLAAALADYGQASLLKVQLCDLPRLPMGKLKPTEVRHACMPAQCWRQPHEGPSLFSRCARCRRDWAPRCCEGRRVSIAWPP